MQPPTQPPMHLVPGQADVLDAFFGLTLIVLLALLVLYVATNIYYNSMPRKDEP